jgi:hypothetical protein
MAEKHQAALVAKNSSKVGFNLDDFDIVTDVETQAGNMDCEESYEVWTFTFEWPPFYVTGHTEKGCA